MNRIFIPKDQRSVLKKKNFLEFREREREREREVYRCGVTLAFVPLLDASLYNI